MILNLLDRMKFPFRKNKEFLTALYNILGFYPHNIEIYRIAFAHKSLSYKPGDRRISRDDRRVQRDRRRERMQNEPCKPLNNERLEFLGDAVLETVVSDIVFHHFDRKREGFLTATRSKIVQRETLNRLAAEMKLDKLIQAAQGTKMSNTNIGGNAFEALMGAIYLDRGFKYCHWFISHRIIGPYIDIDSLAQKEVNFKSKLLEWCQKNRINQQFRMEGGEGDKAFRTMVVIEGLVAGRGQGHSKKESQQNAAKEALMKLRRESQFSDAIFRAKEKRTAMEADESFALPKIDEIEESLRNEKGGKHYGNLPVLEDENGKELRSSDDAYDDAYNAEMDIETIAEPEVEKTERNGRRKKAKLEDEEIDFYETTLEFPGDAIEESPVAPVPMLSKAPSGVDSVAEEGERKPKRKRKTRAERAKAAAERMALEDAEADGESTDAGAGEPVPTETLEVVSAQRKEAPETLTATILPEESVEGENMERSRRKRNRNRKAEAVEMTMEETEEKDEAETETVETEAVPMLEAVEEVEVAEMVETAREEIAEEIAAEPVSDFIEVKLETVENLEIAEDSLETKETVELNRLIGKNEVAGLSEPDEMPAISEPEETDEAVEPEEPVSESDETGSSDAYANSDGLGTSEYMIPAVADFVPEPVVSGKLHSIVQPGDGEHHRPRPARKKLKSHDGTTNREASFDSGIEEPEINPELQNIVMPDFIEIALHAIDAEPESLPMPHSAPQQPRKQHRDKRQPSSEKCDNAPVARNEDCRSNEERNVADVKERTASDVSACEEGEGKPIAKRNGRRGHARRNPGKQ